MSSPRSRHAQTDAPPSHRKLAWLLPALLVLGAAQLCFWFGVDSPLQAQLSGPQSAALLVVGQAWLLLSLAVLLWRVVLVLRYRPTPHAGDDTLPEVTVILPAYNEGEQVLGALRSLAASDYPLGKLHLVAIDDGSVDDTWAWLCRAQRELGDRVETLRLPENRGKRAALYEGFSRARGDVIITVDSDCELPPSALRSLVSPLVADPRVGAVAGNVRVLRPGSALLPRMLDVSFTYAFEFMRASQSEVDAVLCCPGALSAYRRSLVEDVKDEWLAQRFLGAPAGIGEDRALTNLALRSGYTVRFQSDAIVLTEVPTTVKQLSRMLLRWARSNVRETLALAAFAFTRFHDGRRYGTRLNLCWDLSRLVSALVLFVPTVALLVAKPVFLLVALGATLAAATLPAAVFVACRREKGALWAFPYAVFNLFALSWIGPWAVVTARSSGWLTRANPSLPAAAARTRGRFLTGVVVASGGTPESP